jgi:HSP20 family molecular chaperone IbpA
MNLIPKRIYLGDLFDDLLTSGTDNLKCDIYEKDGNYIIETDIPGFKKEDIKIDVEDGYITINVSREEEKDDEGKNYLRRERYSSSYKRQIYLGNIDEDNIKAEFKDATLKIMVPKKEELPNTKRIEIE